MFSFFAWIAWMTISGTAVAEVPAVPNDCKGVIIRQSGPTFAQVGEEIEYQVSIRNEGSCFLRNSLVSAYIPRLTEFRSADPDSRPTTDLNSTEKLSWSGVSLEPEGSARFTIRLRIVGDPNRVIDHTVCIFHPWRGRSCDTLQTFVR